MSVLTTSNIDDSGDWKEVRQGDYIVINNVWGKASLGYVPNFTQSITIDNDADLTSGIHMDWNWDVDSNNRNVLSYPEISVGYKPWDPLEHGTASLSAKIQDIKTFNLTSDLTIGGETNRFDVAYDFWLTNKPMGDEYSITTELMVWTHTGGPVDNDTQPIGFYTLGDTTFKIIKYEGFGDFDHTGGPTWRYIALVPDKDVLNATIDIKDVFYDLIDRGVLSDSDYVTGYELGAEVTGGAGNLTINHVSHELDAYGANSRANTLSGTDDNDRMYGLAGKDTLLGNVGDDFLSGGKQPDKLTGGAGNDTFFFNDIGKMADVIYDFTSGQDKIALDADIFSALTEDEFGAGAFKIGRKFSADDHILYSKSSGKVFYDADGSGSADTAHLIITLENHAALKYSDFELL